MFSIEYNTASGPVEETFDTFAEAKEKVDYLRTNKTMIRNVKGQDLIDYINQVSSKQES